MGRMDIAVEHGADVAIFVHNLVYWVEKNAANGKHFHDGRYWTYNSVKALGEMYPLWSANQIRNIVKKAETAGLIVTGNYNTKPMDRTMWYSPSDEVLRLYGLEKYTFAIWEKSQMDLGKNTNAFGKIPTAIPSSIPSSNQEDTPHSPPEGDGAQSAEKPKGKRGRARKAVPDHRPEKFEGFWQSYPRDEDRAKAAEQWDACLTDKTLLDRHGGEDGLLREIALGLKRHLASEDWQKGIGIPYAFRWLRDRRWTEKAKSGPDPGARLPAEPRRHHIEIVDGEEVIVYDEPDPR